MTMQCKICAGAVDPAFEARLLFKYDVEFFQCRQCGFLQTHEPHWLDEAYADAIIPADTGVLQRNASLARVCSLILLLLFSGREKFADLAGGYGLFVRMMRDAGFDFRWSDKYCQNIFARGFEATTEDRFAAVTAFEVLEHVPDPVRFVLDAFQSSASGTLIFTTELFAGKAPQPADWWYYCFEAGQHISFFTRESLQALARAVGKTLHSRGSIHMLTDRSISPAVFSLLTSQKFARLLGFVPRMLLPSRTMPDHVALIGRQH